MLAELCRSEDKKNVALRLERTCLRTGEEQVRKANNNNIYRLIKMFCQY